MHQDNRLVRQSEHHLTLAHNYDFPVDFLATEGVPLESKGVDELLGVTRLADTLSLLQKRAPYYFGGVNPSIEKISVTPDFHKGAGIPIGTVLSTQGFAVPQAIGNDVNCGMRLMSTPLDRQSVESAIDRIVDHTRYVFFEGGRGIPMTSDQREALVLRGLPGLLAQADETSGMGIWEQIDPDRELSELQKVHNQGGFDTLTSFALQDYLQSKETATYDNLIGGLGGGNHFAEVQYVKKIHDGYTANAWGIKEGQVVIMVHCGSLGLGHIAGRWFLEQLRNYWPDGLPHPENGIYPLPIEGPSELYSRFMTSMNNAANFAFGNRFFLAQMLRKSMMEIIGDFDITTIYDAPHNLMWQDRPGHYIHRKGASPAHDWDGMADTPFSLYGEPVIVPGSMGASSWLLAGRGSELASHSSCHGAGRALSRGEALKVDDRQLDDFLGRFRVVAPVDPKRADIRQQKHVLKAWRNALKREAPFAYKSITPVIETLSSAGMAKPVAELFPLLTVKG